jgi:hypothetical protein
MSGEHPATVPDRIIAEIRAREVRMGSTSGIGNDTEPRSRIRTAPTR